MLYHMKLRPSPYYKMKSGIKTIELRLNDEKRRQIQPGDTIVFSNTEIPELKLTTQVVALHHYPSFAELFEFLPINMCGFDHEKLAAGAVAEMRQYYSAEQEEKYGVLGIEIRLIHEENDWTKNCSNSFDVNAFMKRMERMKQGENRGKAPF